MTILEIETCLSSFSNRCFDKYEISAIQEELMNLKKKAILKDNQNEAKNVWSLEQINGIQVNYYTSFEKMKEGMFYSAWCILEECEIRLDSLYRHFSFSNNLYSLNFIRKQVKQYQSLFPYKLFISPGYIKNEIICSTCGNVIAIRNHCGHEIGEIYNGQMCHRRVTKCEIIEVSIVHTPVQKYSVLSIDGSKLDTPEDRYDYSVIKSLLKRIDTPFEDWDAEWTKIRHPHSKFSNIDINDKCPCESEKKYKDCCLNESGVLRPHCQITFYSPKNIESLKVEYNN